MINRLGAPSRVTDKLYQIVDIKPTETISELNEDEIVAFQKENLTKLKQSNISQTKDYQLVTFSEYTKSFMEQISLII